MNSLKAASVVGARRRSPLDARPNASSFQALTASRASVSARTLSALGKIGFAISRSAFSRTVSRPSVLSSPSSAAVRAEAALQAKNPAPATAASVTPPTAARIVFVLFI